MKKSMAFFGCVALVIAGLPFMASANAVTELQLPDTTQTNTQTDFYVTASNLPATTEPLISKIIIDGAALTEVRTLEFWTGNNWSKLTLFAIEGSVVAPHDHLSANSRYRISFNVPKTYVIGHVFESGPNVLSSTSKSIVVTGQVLSESITAKHVFNTNLGYGSRGNDVLELQKVYVSQGHLRVNPTGYFGPLTYSATKKYQSLNGLPSTGWVGPLTRAKLNQ